MTHGSSYTYLLAFLLSYAHNSLHAPGHINLATAVERSRWNWIGLGCPDCARELTAWWQRGAGDRTIEHFDFLTGEKRTLVADGAPSGTALQGHTGADYYLMKSFVQAVAKGDASLLLTGPTESLRSHRLVFAAERARRLGRTIVPDDVAVEELLQELSVEATVGE